MVGFHFLILAAGEILKEKPTCTAQNVQDYIAADPSFGVRVPLEECRLALKLSADCGLLSVVNRSDYVQQYVLKGSLKDA